MAAEERMRVNLNPMQISSPVAFMNVSGMVRDGKKDVYFVRYTGYEKEMEYVCQIQEMDRCLKERQSAGGGGYLRVEKLETRVDPDEVQRYAQEYEKRCEGQESGELRFSFADEAGRHTMQAAFLAVIELYQRSGAGISPSMCRNFGVKLLFWAERYLPLLFSSGRNEEPFPKFVVSGNIKVQEYLFLYFLVCLGCDVLYMNPEADLPLSEELLSLSYGYKEKNQGSIVIPPYHVEAAACKITVQDAKQRAEGSAADNLGDTAAGALQSGSSGNVRLDGSRLARPSSKRKGTAGNGAAGFAPSVSSQNGAAASVSSSASASADSAFSTIASVSQTLQPGAPGAADFDAQRRELSYEELAQLSSAVVMIACHNEKGECFKTGSGVVISEKGYLLTNFHVACQTAYYSIRFEEEEQVYKTDELVKYNQFYDLAVIKIEKHCSPLRLYRGKKELVRGQKVVAIGSPLGLFNSVSDGIIAGFRVLDDVSMIQFTAPISHGSSGGALLNLYGELIGINTAGFDDGQNINLAVDYKTVQAFAGGFLK